MRLFMPALALAMASLAVPLRATTTVAPTFAELVSAAVTIVESEVLETRARYVSGRERTIIVTDVIVRVAQTFKGREQSSMVLTFHGGTVGDVTYRIDGMPTFAVGDRDVLFIQGEEGISPLVGMMHGRVRAVTDPTTREVSVRRFDGRPLRDASAVTFRRTEPLFSDTPAMSLESFTRAVRGEVSRQRAAR